MSISAADVQALRKATGAGMMDCKHALNESGGDKEKAIEFLRKHGASKVAKRSEREASEGMIHSYIHMGGKIGVMVELNCETDFVARTDDFTNLANDIALHVAASSPEYMNRDEVPEEQLNKEKEIYKEQALASGKPEKVIEKIIEGRIEKYYQEICLVDQPFVKDPDKTVGDLVKEAAAKLGENIRLARFVRFQLGE